MGEITPHHIQQLQQLLPQMHTQTQQQNQYMWPPQAPQNPEPPQINSSGGKHNKQTFFVLINANESEIGYLIYRLIVWRLIYIFAISAIK